MNKSNMPETNIELIIDVEIAELVVAAVVTTTCEIEFAKFNSRARLGDLVLPPEDKHFPLRGNSSERNSGFSPWRSCPTGLGSLTQGPQGEWHRG